MSKPTGEDEQGLHRILHSLRMASIILLLLHFYLHSCPGCRVMDEGDQIIQRLSDALRNLPFLGQFLAVKTVSILMLGISLLGAGGKKEPEFKAENGLGYLFLGIVIFYGSGLFSAVALLYIVFCSAGWFLTLHGGNYLSRIVWRKAPEDIFNRQHESFPQEQRLIENTRSINLPAHYQYNGASIESWINFVVPARGTIILGSPGSGKTAYVLEHFIRQMIQKHYAMVIHDFKYDDLSGLAYNYFIRYRSLFPGKAAFYNIQLDDPSRSNRCNLLHPSTLRDITDAEEAARSLLLGLNMNWISTQGEFFVESAIAYVKALIWYLRLYKDGIYCTWPHVIELAQTDRDKLFSILPVQPEVQAVIKPFIDAGAAPETLVSQLSSANIGLSRLISPQIYYILSGDDFTLDCNNPDAPKIIALGNNPQKSSTYGPIISAYLNTISRLCNRKNANPLALILEEFSTISVHTIDKTIATGRSNDIATVLCLQNINQLKHTYGEKFADVVLNTCGNIISGQVTGETARLLADRFGRTMQHRESLTATYSDLQITESHQLESVIPESRIATLSAGEFVGMVVDNPAQPIQLKTFCCHIDHNFPFFEKEKANFEPLPIIREVSEEEIKQSFLKIRREIEMLVQDEIAAISDSPELRHLVQDNNRDLYRDNQEAY